MLFKVLSFMFHLGNYCTLQMMYLEVTALLSIIFAMLFIASIFALFIAFVRQSFYLVSTIFMMTVLHCIYFCICFSLCCDVSESVELLLLRFQKLAFALFPLFFVLLVYFLFRLRDHWLICKFAVTCRFALVFIMSAKTLFCL